MKYEGKLYGKIAGRYIEMTQSITDLENEIKELKSFCNCNERQAIETAKGIICYNCEKVIGNKN